MCTPANAGEGKQGSYLSPRDDSNLTANSSQNAQPAILPALQQSLQGEQQAPVFGNYNVLNHGVPNPGLMSHTGGSA